MAYKFKDYIETAVGMLESSVPRNDGRFKFACPTEEMYGLLSCAYVRVCGMRGFEAQLDDALLERLGRVAEWLTGSSTKPSVIFHGDYGNGKTTMINAVAETISALKAAWPKEPTYTETQEDLDLSLGLYKSLPTLALTTATSLCYIAENKPDKFEATLNVPMLSIDDVGSEPGSVKRYGTETNPFREVIYYRYETMLPTIITTNLNPTGLRNRYGGRIGDRLREMCEVIEFTNPSYRR